MFVLLMLNCCTLKHFPVCFKTILKSRGSSSGHTLICFRTGLVTFTHNSDVIRETDVGDTVVCILLCGKCRPGPRLENAHIDDIPEGRFLDQHD